MYGNIVICGTIISNGEWRLQSYADFFLVFTVLQQQKVIQDQSSAIMDIRMAGAALMCSLSWTLYGMIKEVRPFSLSFASNRNQWLFLAGREYDYTKWNWVGSLFMPAPSHLLVSSQTDCCFSTCCSSQVSYSESTARANSGVILTTIIG